MSVSVNRQASAVVCFDDAAGVRVDGAALFATAEIASFDLGADWFELLMASGLPRDSRARFYVLPDHGGSRVILPLILGEHQANSLTTYYTTLFRPLLAQDARPAEVGAVLRHVLENTGVSSFKWHALDPDHASFQILLDGMRSAGLTVFTFFDFGNWYQPVDGMSYAAYFSGLPSRVRNTVKRRGRKFVAEQDGRIEILRADRDVDELIEIWSGIYGKSWKRPEPYPDFVPGLIRICASRGWLRFGVAYARELPVAAQIWIVNAGRAAIYKLAYDGDFASYSVGTLLTDKLMHHVIDVDRVSEIDYLVGDDAYKKDWMSQRRERMGIVAYDRRSLRGLLGMSYQYLSRLRQYWR